MRSLYPNGRRDQTAAWLVVEVGLLRADGPPGYGEGNHEVIDWDELGALAQTKGILINPGRICFGATAAPQNYFRLAFSSIDEKKIEPGIKLLAELIRAPK